MSNPIQLDPPADLRIISRPFALAASAPSDRPEQALQNISTGRLETGALALVRNLTSSSGSPALYVFDKSPSYTPTEDLQSFTAPGGGAWRRYPAVSSTGSVGLESSRSQSASGVVDLTAGGGDMEVLSITPYQPEVPSTYRADIIARCQVQGGAVAGAVVEVRLETRADGGTWFAQDTRVVTLGVEENVDLVLIGATSGDKTTETEFRLVANATVQDAQIPSTPGFGTSRKLKYTISILG